jgi:hypothetical protein
MHMFIRQAQMLFAGALFLVACGTTQEQQNDPSKGPASSVEGEVCPTVDPGPPPVCPEGCQWNGTECRKKSGIIVYDAAPTGTSTATPAPTTTPTQ